jgi:hypothetical protein
MSDRELSVCGRAVHWWDGEYEGECIRPSAHEGDHFDGASWYDNAGEPTNEAHNNQEPPDARVGTRTPTPLKTIQFRVKRLEQIVVLAEGASSVHVECPSCKVSFDNTMGYGPVTQHIVMIMHSDGCMAAVEVTVLGR